MDYHRQQQYLPQPQSKATFDRKAASKKTTIFLFLTILVLFILFIRNYNENHSPSLAIDGNIIRFVTPLGHIVVKLRPDAAPLTVEHFKKLLDMDFYEGCFFYRAEPNFVVQGGARTLSSWKESPLPDVTLEYQIPNARGTLAMARREENNTGNTEFFFNVGENQSKLAPNGNSGGYAVFGEVIDGLTTIDALSAQPTTLSGGLKILQEYIPYSIYYEKDYVKGQ